MATNWALSREDVSITAHAAPSLLRRLIETIREWQRRVRSRRELARLSYFEIKDLANRAEVEAEKCKPFWKP